MSYVIIGCGKCFPVYFSGRRFVSHHIDLSYRIHHLLQTEDPGVIDCSMQLVKAAKDVRDISNMDESELPMLMKEKDGGKKKKGVNKKKQQHTSGQTSSRKNVKKVPAQIQDPEENRPSTSQAGFTARTLRSSSSSTTIKNPNRGVQRSSARLTAKTRNKLSTPTVHLEGMVMV